MSKSVTLRMLQAGYCRHLECMADRGGRFVQTKFPALCGLIRHPDRGWILYDTGYSDHFFDATKQWPERLYQTMLPVNLPHAECLPGQLALLGISPPEIAMVIVSHFHGDHIAGLKDFPNARFVAIGKDIHAIESLRGHRWKATLNGQLPGLLPEDFMARTAQADKAAKLELPSWMSPFDWGFDLLGDGSLIGVPLPGHSHGQMGLFIPDADGRPAFLVADACWSITACMAGRLPSRLAMFTSANRKDYRSTFAAVQSLLLREPGVSILPSHCSAATEEFNRAAN